MNASTPIYTNLTSQEVSNFREEDKSYAPHLNISKQTSQPHTQ